MTPTATSAQTMARWPASGVRASVGTIIETMPAWSMRLTDAQIWDVVSFIERLPALSPQAYADATRRAADEPVPSNAADQAECPGDCPQQDSPISPIAGGDRADRSVPPTQSEVDEIARGRIALSLYACTACHTIPGVTSSQLHVGPPLAGMASRTLIVGRLPNTPDNLARWLREPQAIKPLTAMPAMGMTDAHARDMAAYLGTLR